MNKNISGQKKEFESRKATLLSMNNSCNVMHVFLNETYRLTEFCGSALRKDIVEW